MRWESLRLPNDGTAGASADALPLAVPGAVVRTFDTPRFRGMTFYEVRARSIINKVPAVSRVPFQWTINPYRGCSHACVYCFARGTHAYLDFDVGRDFDTQVVVKVNAAEVLRRELAAPRWAGAAIAMGTNVDCYQRAEGRYALMPGILRALRDAKNPFSILTKGSLILRDLELLQDAAQVTDVSTAVSIGLLDEELWRLLEPGTPSPRRRLQVCARLTDAGLRCNVLMAPIVPFLTDSPAQLEATVKAIAETGAASVSPVVLHLRPGAREWFLTWLGEHHPELVEAYGELYRRGAYAPKAYQEQVAGQVRELADDNGIGHGGADRRRARPNRRFDPRPVGASRPAATPVPQPGHEQLPLL